MPTISEQGRGWGRASAILLVAAAIGLGTFLIWRVDSAPRTDVASAYADTISVTPEVSGRIIDLVAKDNQPVRKGDVLFRIDPRPFEDTLSKAQATLAALDLEIQLTQRTVNALLANARTQSNTLIAQYNQAVVDSVRQVAQSGLELEDLRWAAATGPPWTAPARPRIPTQPLLLGLRRHPKASGSARRTGHPRSRHRPRHRRAPPRIGSGGRQIGGEEAMQPCRRIATLVFGRALYPEQRPSKIS
jgi:hypothetical protein